MTSRRAFPPAWIVVDRNSPRPLQRQITDAIAAAISEGALCGGSRLPSTRTLAKELGVSRNTVASAYDSLHRRGLIAGVSGSGTRVAGRGPIAERHSAWVQALKTSHYPLRTAQLLDADGNLLYLSDR